MLEFARSYRLPSTWRDPERADDPAAASLVAGLDEAIAQGAEEKRQNEMRA